MENDPILDLNPKPEPDDFIVHACGKVTEGSISIPGSILGRCYQCGCKIVMSPTSTALVEAKAAEIGRTVRKLCRPCAMPYITKPGTHIMPWTAEQRREYVEALKASGIKDIEKHMRGTP